MEPSIGTGPARPPRLPFGASVDSGGDSAMLQVLSREIRALDERVPIVAMKTLREHRDSSMSAWLVRAAASLFTLFGAAGDQDRAGRGVPGRIAPGPARATRIKAFAFRHDDPVNGPVELSLDIRRRDGQSYAGSKPNSVALPPAPDADRPGAGTPLVVGFARMKTARSMASALAALAVQTAVSLSAQSRTPSASDILKSHDRPPRVRQHRQSPDRRGTGPAGRR